MVKKLEYRIVIVVCNFNDGQEVRISYRNRGM
jgi:hypothetical protein